jgi:ribosomal protein L24E
VPKRIRVLKCYVMIWKWKRNPRNIIWIIQIINTRLITEK